MGEEAKLLDVASRQLVDLQATMAKLGAILGVDQQAPEPTPTPDPTPKPTPVPPAGDAQWPVEPKLLVEPATGDVLESALPLIDESEVVPHKYFASGQIAILGPRTLKIPPNVLWIKNPRVMDLATLVDAMVAGGFASMDYDDFIMLFEPWGTGQTAHTGRFGRAPVSHMPYRRAEVYQCVPQYRTVNDTFREPYTSEDLAFSLSEIRYDVIPGRNYPVGDMMRFQNVPRLFDRVGIGIGEDWIGRRMHAGENEPNYWRDYAALLADALCYLACKTTDRGALLKGLLQRAIDWYGCMLADLADDSVWSADSSLYRILVSVAGKILGHPEMEACAVYRDRVDRNFYWGTHRDLGHTVCFQKDGRKYEHVPRDQWTQRMRTDEKYRFDESKAMLGLAAAAKAFGVEQYHETLMAYAERYYAEGGPVSSEFSRYCYVSWVASKT